MSWQSFECHKAGTFSKTSHSGLISSMTRKASKKRLEAGPCESLLTSETRGAHVADVGAGAAEGDAIDGLEPGGASHVAELLGIGKSVSKHSPVDGVVFDLPDCFPAGAFEADSEAFDSCKNGAMSFQGLGGFVEGAESFKRGVSAESQKATAWTALPWRPGQWGLASFRIKVWAQIPRRLQNWLGVSQSALCSVTM